MYLNFYPIGGSKKDRIPHPDFYPETVANSFRINALLSWCEQFQKELGSDSYVDLYVPPEGSNVPYNGGILAMDYNLTEGMQDACDEVEAATDEVTDVLLNALADCRGLVDGADGLMEQVSAASRKLHRVKNLKTAVTLYGMGIKNLERDLQAGWRSAMAEAEARKAVYREAEGQRELPTWADHEATQICLALEEYVQTRNYDKMREIMSSMIIEQYDQRDTVNGPATYYVVKLSANRRQQLLEKANDMKLTGAYQFALALEGLRVEGVPADKQGSGSYDIQFGLWTIKDRIIHMSIMTDQTAAWCEVEVGDPLPKEEYTEWDRYIDLGLTGYVKYGYHEIIDYMPDGAMLLFGERNAFIRIGSTIQAYAKDDREHLDDYIIQNSRTFSHGFTEGFWDLTLGGLESSINSLVKYVSEPALYFVDTVRGNYEGSTSQRIYKTGLAAMQLMTGQPVFTVNEHAGEVIDAVATVKRNIQAVCELDWQEVAEDVKSLKEQIYLDFQKNPDAFIDNFTDKFYYGSGYLDGAVTGIIADAVVAETVAGVIKGDAVTSYADLMSPEDAEKYLNFLENGSSAGLTDEEIAGIKKLDDLLALEKVDYQDILNMRNADDILKGGTGSKFNDLLNSEYYKTHPGFDCSEIAEEFYDAANRQGKIYRIEGKNGIINGYEYGNIEEYLYHEVYSDGINIYDPRYSNMPVPKRDYFRMLREINIDGFDVFERIIE